MENIFADVARFFHLRMSRGVDLNHVHTGFIGNCFAGGAFAAGLPVHRVFTVESFGENTRRSGFADTARSDKQICMGDPSRYNRIAQSPGYMFLPDHVGKTLRTPFSGCYLICHKILPLSVLIVFRCSAADSRTPRSDGTGRIPEKQRLRKPPIRSG